MGFLTGALILGGMLVGLLLIPVGVPGLWIMAAVAAAAWLLGAVGLWTAVAVVALAAAAELLEFLLLRKMSLRYGGSRGAFWGAMAGGLIGLFVGLPVPVLGPLITAVVGTFVGAAVVTLVETRHVGRSARVGWGTVLGRIAAVFVKVAAGVAMLVVVGVALLRG